MAKAVRTARTFLLSTLLAGVCLPATTALAQDPGASEENSEEIVVTARRREEALQDVPVAVTAVSAAELERRQIDTIAQVGESVPNLNFQTGAPTGTGASTPSVFIRGIGSSETSLGTEPGVGLYVDDVYVAVASAAFSISSIRNLCRSCAVPKARSLAATALAAPC